MFRSLTQIVPRIVKQGKLSAITSQNVVSNLRFLSSDNPAHDRIAKLVKEDKIVVFMKGTPEEPRCGFSNAVVRVLEMHGLPNGSYKAHDVLEDAEIREGVKKFSDWPTIPQVYFNGDFIGGCDIFVDMHKDGTLTQELKKIGITSTIADEKS